MAMKRIMAAAAIAILATACSKEDDVVPPAELVDFDPAVSIDRVWSAGTKGGDDVLRLGLAAGRRGRARLCRGSWRRRPCDRARDGAGSSGVRPRNSSCRGGPSVGEGIVVVGSSGGELIALDAETGAKRWQVATGGEVLTAPTVASGIVVVRTVDGRLRGLRVENGSRGLELRATGARASRCAGTARRSLTATW